MIPVMISVFAMFIAWKVGSRAENLEIVIKWMPNPKTAAPQTCNGKFNQTKERQDVCFWQFQYAS